MAESIRLREYNKKDLDRHLELFLMNGVCKKITLEIRNKEKRWLNRVISNYGKIQPSFYVLAITLNNQLIGNLIAEKIDYKNKTVEIGFWIGKDFWSKGYATKALNLFLKILKSKFNPSKVIARHKTENVASRKVLEKVGFVFDDEKEGIKSYSKIL